jgi:hypothetical protein
LLLAFSFFRLPPQSVEVSENEGFVLDAVGEASVRALLSSMPLFVDLDDIV